MRSRQLGLVVRSLAAISLAVSMTAASVAETLSFEAHEGIRVVRWVDMFGQVSVELIADPAIDLIECVALDANKQPIAVANGFSGAMIFTDLDVEKIADVACREG